jgi:hypothetical protein
MRRWSTVLTACVIAFVGCSDPYSRAPATAPSHPATTQATPAPTAPRAGPGAAPSRPQVVKALGATPAAAVTTFARLYTNWTAATVAARLGRLAHSSAGDAAAEMARAAQESRGDYELHRSGVFNRGTVESVAPLPGHPRRYIVVTLEATGAKSKQYAGLRPAFHVTLVTVEPTNGGWTVSAWQPQT